MTISRVGGGMSMGQGILVEDGFRVCLFSPRFRVFHGTVGATGLTVNLNTRTNHQELEVKGLSA